MPPHCPNQPPPAVHNFHTATTLLKTSENSRSDLWQRPVDGLSHAADSEEAAELLDGGRRGAGMSRSVADDAVEDGGTMRVRDDGEGGT